MPPVQLHQVSPAPNDSCVFADLTFSTLEAQLQDFAVTPLSLDHPAFISSADAADVINKDAQCGGIT
eukprot:98239-Karenia_brevis.AAC.1